MGVRGIFNRLMGTELNDERSTMNGGEFAIRRQKSIRRATFTGLLGIIAAILAMLLVAAIVAFAFAAEPGSELPYTRGDTVAETNSGTTTTPEP